MTLDQNSYFNTSFGLSVFLYYLHLAFLAYVFKGISRKRDDLPLDLLQLLCVFILPVPVAARSKAPYTLSVKLSFFDVWCNTWRKNWVKCAVLAGNSVGHRTVFSSRLSHTEMRSSLKESHSFLSLPTDTTMASSQGTSVSSNSFSRWASHGIFLFKYHFVLHT